MSVAEWTNKQAVLRDLAEVTQGIVPSRFNNVIDKPGRYVVEDEGIDEEYFRYYNGDGHISGPDIFSITQMLKLVNEAENSEEDLDNDDFQDIDYELRKWNVNAKEFIPEMRGGKPNKNVKLNGVCTTNGECTSTKSPNNTEILIDLSEPTIEEKPETSKQIEPVTKKKKKIIRNIAIESILASIEKEKGPTTPERNVTPVTDKNPEASPKKNANKLISPKTSPNKINNETEASTTGAIKKKVSSYVPPGQRKPKLSSPNTPYSGTSMFSKKCSTPISCSSSTSSSCEKDLSKGPVLTHTSMFKRKLMPAKPLEVKPEEPKLLYPKFEPKSVPKDAFKKVHVPEPAAADDFERNLLWASVEEKLKTVDENKKKQAKDIILIKKRMEELEIMEQLEMVDTMPDYPEVCALDIHRHFLDGECAVCNIRASIELKYKSK